MEKEFDEIFSKLAQKIDSMIPVEWIELYYLGEVEKGRLSCSSVFYFTEKNNKSEFKRSHEIPLYYGVSDKVYMELLSELNNHLLELYDCFKLNEQELWEQVSIYINNSGKLNIDFKYDVMNENDGGQVRREAIWAYETFKYESKKGTYTRRILDEYIKEKSE